jgi:hypothetical protein
MARLYPHLIKYCKITVYDVAPTILPMFDEKLGNYATKQFAREGIHIKTSHHIQKIRQGLPRSENGKYSDEEHFCLTMDVKEEGEVGVGLLVWSTGLMMNPFVKESLSKPQRLALGAATSSGTDSDRAIDWDWLVKKDPRSDAVITDDRLRLIMESSNDKDKTARAVMQVNHRDSDWNPHLTVTGRFCVRGLCYY